ncbi:hypothetical protein P175DRAFT_0529877 [Aspergillus ochraceoroseus IBT 24754]|uniref:N-acetyltransferase domain-containing protein n=1 Tax=Aspergillus ochraceoroseus IBT 24754 TaxID=1392256 RepID=A0A2T5M2N3_9EURO|nr:uncharacterized protein P175DRAFT_0529877 [Aspergillus ochraceoroseus IBT 24754]PTU22800.1 hypothetical protein P175DRAFT_0529877 [Aspergillus ochraceoroseus IBT 24754]
MTQFQTNRLRFTLLDPGDVDGMYALRSENEVMKWSRQKAPDADIEATQTWLCSATAQEPCLLFCVRELDLPAAGKVCGEPQSQAQADKVVGLVGLREEHSIVTGGHERYEIGYMFVPWSWGKGYASEAVRGVMAEWFEGRLGEAVMRGEARRAHGIYSVVARGNVASFRVLEKCGFEVVGLATCPFAGPQLRNPGELASGLR